MEPTLDVLLRKMAEQKLTAEEILLLEEKARKFSDLNKLVEARQEWREAMKKYLDTKNEDGTGAANPEKV